MNKNQIKERAVESVRRHRSPIGVCLLVVLILFIAGQIVAGPGSWPFVIGLFFLAILVHFSKTHYGKTFLAFIVLSLIFIGFLYVKGATASSSELVSSIRVETQVPTAVVQEKAEKTVEKAVASQKQAAAKSKKIRTTCKELKMFDLNVQQWCDLIKKYSAKHGADPLLVASIIKPESGGNQTSVSWAGAVGIMQVMPKEAGFSKRPTAKELLDPETNIAAGVKVLADCFSTYGNLRDSVQCYYGFGEGYYYADVLVLPTYEAAKAKSNKN
jgi:hypothetical protein